ncbi:MAG: hemolysin family protein [Chthoniobacterales bacterium]
MSFFHQLIVFFVHELLEPLLLILFGGIVVLAEIFLNLRKGGLSQKHSSRRSRSVLWLTAIFFFMFAAVIATDNLHDEVLRAGFLEYLMLLVGLALLLTLTVLFFGVVLPRAIGESLSVSWLTRALSQFACVMTSLLDPVASVSKTLTINILKIFGLHLYENAPASDNEVIHMMDEGLNSGVFKASEKEMVQGVLDLDEQITASLMTPRSCFVWLNLDDDNETNWRRVVQSGHSEFPVFQGTHDQIKGIVSVKALWANLSLTGSVKLADVTMVPPYVPSTMTASQLIEEFRGKKHHTALVIDEFGVIEGIVTLKDVMESIIGMLPERGVKQYYPVATGQADGSWIIDAMLNIEESIAAIGISLGENEQEGIRYQTIGGFFLAQLGHIPHAGEFILWKNFRFEVLSMNHHRIEKLLVRRLKGDVK